MPIRAELLKALNDETQNIPIAHERWPELAVEFVFGVVLQAMRAAAEGRLAPTQTGEIVAGVLRAIGVAAEQAQEISIRAQNATASASAVA